METLGHNKPKIKLSINPPPADSKCECCGTHVSKIKAFGKASDPLQGDFEGAKLVKNFRAMALPITDERYIKIEKEYKEKDYEGFEEALFEIFSAETEKMLLRAQLADTIEASWECRDCITLNIEDYFKTKFGDIEKEGED